MPTHKKRTNRSLLFKRFAVPLITSAGTLLTPIHTLAETIAVQESATEMTQGAITTLASQIQQHLKLDKPLYFREVTAKHAAPGFYHLQQTYQGLDVDGSLIAVKLDEHGQLLRVYGEPVTSFLTSNAASASATAHHLSPNTSPSARQGHNTLSTKNINTSTLNTQHSLDATALAQDYLRDLADYGTWHIDTLTQKTVLYVNEHGQATPTLKVQFYADNLEAEKFVRPILWFSLDSGTLIHSEQSLTQLRQAGSGPGGNVLTGKKFYAYQTDATNALEAATFLVERDADTQTCTMAITPNTELGETWHSNVTIINGKDAAEAYQYPCTDENAEHNDDNSNSESLGAYGVLNDASYYAQIAFNFYDNFAITQQKGPLNEIGRPLIVKAHYGFSDNAFWNGNFIALGDGYRDFYPKVSIDTLGHELAHAYLEHYSQVYQGGTSFTKGIIESFADIAGEATEYLLAQQQNASQSNDWKYAAETFGNNLDEAGRYFNLPSRDGRSIDSAKDVNPSVKAYHLAGPMSHAFYRLITDNNGWNPIIGYELWMTAAKNCWVDTVTYVSASQCIVDSIPEFREHNTTLPADWSAADVEKAVIHAFSQTDIITHSAQQTLALFDYEYVFDQIRLVNASSIDPNQDTTFSWDLNSDGSIEHTSDHLDDTFLFTPEANQETLSVTLSIQQNGTILDTVTRTIDITPNYCIPDGYGVQSPNDSIQQIIINDHKLPITGMENNYYGNYTHNEPTELFRNSENKLVLIPINENKNKTWIIHLDLNGDHQFSPEEEILKTSGKGVINTTFLLNSANHTNLNKDTRLRITMDSSYITPCDPEYYNGEVEDYRVKLVNHDTSIQPEPSFRYQQVDDSLQVNFTNTTQHIPDNTSWQWLLVGTNGAEEVIGTKADLNYSFTQPGEYRIRLSLLKAGQRYQSEQSIQVNPITERPDLYCQAGTETDDMYLDTVVLTKRRNNNMDYPILNVSTGYNVGGYTLYRTNALLNNEQEYGLVVSVKGHPHKPRYLYAWLDSNFDQTFSDDELIFSDMALPSKGFRTFRHEFTLSNLSDAGTARLRVYVKTKQNDDPCEVMNNLTGSGEAEDYQLAIN